MALTVTNTGSRKVSVNRGKTVCLYYHSPISSLGGGGGNGGGGGGGESNSYSGARPDWLTLSKN